MQDRPINFDDRVKVSQYPLHSTHARAIELNLSQMNLNDDDIPNICAYLALHPEINSLNLSANYITDIGAIKLAENKTLVDLNVSFNKMLGPKGLLALRDNGMLGWITAGSQAADELPARGEDTEYERYMNAKKYDLSLPLLSLKQLSFFAVRKRFEAIKEPNIKKMKDADKGFWTFCLLSNDPDICKLRKQRAAYVTQVSEWQFTPLKIYMRPTPTNP